MATAFEGVGGGERKHKWCLFHFKVKDEYTAIKENTAVLASPCCCPKCKLYHLPDRYLFWFCQITWYKDWSIYGWTSNTLPQTFSCDVELLAVWQFRGAPFFFECVSVHVCSFVKPSVHQVYESNGLLKRITASDGANWKSTLSFGIVFLYCCEHQFCYLN